MQNLWRMFGATYSVTIQLVCYSVVRHSAGCIMFSEHSMRGNSISRDTNEKCKCLHSYRCISRFLFSRHTHTDTNEPRGCKTKNKFVSCTNNFTNQPRQCRSHSALLHIVHAWIVRMCACPSFTQHSCPKKQQVAKQQHGNMTPQDDTTNEETIHTR